MRWHHGARRHVPPRHRQGNLNRSLIIKDSSLSKRVEARVLQDGDNTLQGRGTLSVLEGGVGHRERLRPGPRLILHGVRGAEAILSVQEREVRGAQHSDDRCADHIRA